MLHCVILGDESYAMPHVVQLLGVSSGGTPPANRAGASPSAPLSRL